MSISTPGGRAFIRGKDLKAKDGLPESTRYKLISEGKYPKPVKLGPRMSAWLEDEVEAWMAARIAERDKAARLAPFFHAKKEAAPGPPKGGDMNRAHPTTSPQRAQNTAAQPDPEHHQAEREAGIERHHVDGRRRRRATSARTP